MFNDYEVFQMMKFRQEETERNAREAWKLYVDSSDNNDLKDLTSAFKTTNSVDPCRHCTCA